MAEELRHFARGIPLVGRGGIIHGFSMVDADDFERFGHLKWGITVPVDGRRRYAQRRCKAEGGPIWLHRAVMGAPVCHDGFDVDHMNHDGLDNRKSNLRVVTRQQNRQNSRGWKHASSQYKGVSWDKRDKCFYAYGWLDGRKHHLGCFKSEQEAAQVAREWRRQNTPYSTI